jgi:hypothetical protein
MLVVNPSNHRYQVQTINQTPYNVSKRQDKCSVRRSSIWWPPWVHWTRNYRRLAQRIAAADACYVDISEELNDTLAAMGVSAKYAADLRPCTATSSKCQQHSQLESTEVRKAARMMTWETPLAATKKREMETVRRRTGPGRGRKRISEGSPARRWTAHQKLQLALRDQPGQGQKGQRRRTRRGQQRSQHQRRNKEAKTAASAALSGEGRNEPSTCMSANTSRRIDTLKIETHNPGRLEPRCKTSPGCTPTRELRKEKNLLRWSSVNNGARHSSVQKVDLGLMEIGWKSLE